MRDPHPQRTLVTLLHRRHLCPVRCARSRCKTTGQGWLASTMTACCPPYRWCRRPRTVRDPRSVVTAVHDRAWLQWRDGRVCCQHPSRTATSSVQVRWHATQKRYWGDSFSVWYACGSEKTRSWPSVTSVNMRMIVMCCAGAVVVKANTRVDNRVAYRWRQSGHCCLVIASLRIKRHALGGYKLSCLHD